MKTITKSLVLVAGLGLLPLSPAFAGSGDAKVAQAVDDETTGSIKSVDAENDRFTVEVDETEVRIQVDESTKYTKDGEEITREEALKAGLRVRVVHKEGVASEIEVLAS